MRIQSSHASANRGRDAYWTCAEAIESLLALEGDRMPRRIWDPACGMGPSTSSPAAAPRKRAVARGSDATAGWDLGRTEGLARRPVTAQARCLPGANR